MTTIIKTNGSKWRGELPDSVDVLKERLAGNTLNPLFEDYGCFAYGALGPDGERGFIHFWGNFLDVSAAFDILTDDDDLILELVQLIKANMDSDAYERARLEHLEDRDRRAARRAV